MRQKKSDTEWWLSEGKEGEGNLKWVRVQIYDNRGKRDCGWRAHNTSGVHGC